MSDERHEQGGHGPCGQDCRRGRGRVRRPLQQGVVALFVNPAPTPGTGPAVLHERREESGHHGAHRRREDDHDGEDAFPVRLHEHVGRGPHWGHGDGLHEPGVALIYVDIFYSASLKRDIPGEGERNHHHLGRHHFSLEKAPRYRNRSSAPASDAPICNS